jgi:rod shape-determining protein MreD
MKTYSAIRYGLTTLALLVLQATFIRFISLGSVTPDILVIWLVYLALRYGQVHATVAGFILGFIMDLIAGDFLGLAALSKTVSGFAAGYFYDEEKSPQVLASYRFAIIVFVVSLVHNLIYFGIFVQGSELPFWQTLAFFGVTTSLYTSAVSVLPILGYSRVKGDRVLSR